MAWQTLFVRTVLASAVVSIAVFAWDLSRLSPLTAPLGVTDTIQYASIYAGPLFLALWMGSLYLSALYMLW